MVILDKLSGIKIGSRIYALTAVAVLATAVLAGAYFFGDRVYHRNP